MFRALELLVECLDVADHACCVAGELETGHHEGNCACWVHTEDREAGESEGERERQGDCTAKEKTENHAKQFNPSCLETTLRVALQSI